MTSPLRFTKLQAAGNDFILLDNRDRRFDPVEFAGLARHLCHRKFGIGADGMMLLEEPDASSGSAGSVGENMTTELIMHYKNPDGSDAGMCGNGARCFVRFAHSLGYSGDIHFQVHGRHYLGSRSGDTITIHFPLQTQVTPIDVDADTVLCVDTHTEHIVIPVEPAQLEETSTLVARGRSLRYHDRFVPKGTNVNFMCGLTDHELKLQTYERGVEGLTLACGTGAIASALAWHYLSGAGGGSYTTTVQAAGGEFYVHFSFLAETGIYHTIGLEGPAVRVFEGSFDEQNLDLVQ